MNLINDNSMYDKKLSTFGLIWQIIKPVLVYLGINIGITIIFVMCALIIDPMDINDANFEIIFTNKYGVVLNILIQIASIIVLYLIYKKDRKTYPKCEKNKLLTIIYGGLLILGVGIISGYFIDLLVYLFPSLESGYSDVENMIVNSKFIPLFITTCLLAPVMEEIMVRGLILNNILSKKSIWFSIIVSALMFGIIHMNLVQGINGFIIGIFLAIVYIKTRNLWACILGHFLNNFISIIFNFIDVSNFKCDIISIVIVILCIYPSIKFLKGKSVSIRRYDSV